MDRRNVLLPVIKDNPQRLELLHKTGLQFRSVGWLALLMLGTTGVTNMLTKGIPFKWGYLTSCSYGRLLLMKMGVFTLILLLSAIHDFYIGTKATTLSMGIENDEAAGKIRTMARWSGRVNLLLALIVLFLGVALARGGF